MKTSSLRQIFNVVKLFNIVITFLMIIGIMAQSCKSSPEKSAQVPPPLIPVTKLKSAAVTTFTDYPASIQGAVDIDIRPQVSGYIQSVLVEEGAYVKAGQILFKINERPYREALNNAIASLHAAEAALLNAQIEVDKVTPLVTNRVVSDIQLRTANTSYRIAKANAEQAKASVAAAKINIGYTDVKASINGYIGRIPKKQGSLVSPQDAEALTKLSEIKRLHVYFALGEQDFSLFNQTYTAETPMGQLGELPQVELILADGTVFPNKGKIDMIDGQFDKNTGAITLRASFSNDNGRLRSGNTGKIRLNVIHKDVILVPQGATIEMQDKIFAYLLKSSNKISKVSIKVIGKSGQDYLIKDGLKAGDEIILSGLDHLQEGQLIQPDRKQGKAAQLIH